MRLQPFRKWGTGKFALGVGKMPLLAQRKVEAEAKQREAEAREREAENSFEKVARKWWDWWAPGKSERHTGYVLRRLEADVFPPFGHKSINVVTAADIRSLMRTIEGRGARDVAKRAHEATGSSFPLCDCPWYSQPKSCRRFQTQRHSR